MVNINTGGASAWILRYRDETYEVLLMERVGGNFDGHWSQIAGGIEEGETAAETVIREMREEADLVPNRLFAVGVLEQFFDALRDHLVIMPTFVALVSSDAEVTLNHEHRAFDWFSFEEARKKVDSKNQRMVICEIRDELEEFGFTGWQEVPLSPSTLLG